MFEVRRIVHSGETVVATLHTMGQAFDDCVSRWADRKAGSPVYAVRDTDTDQRWSYADIKELRAADVVPFGSYAEGPGSLADRIGPPPSRSGSQE